MNKPIPIEIGERHGYLVVMREELNYRDKNGRKQRMYHVRCDCGKELMLTPIQIKKRNKCSKECLAQIGTSEPPSEIGEIWKPIAESNGLYLISNYGKVWSYRKRDYIAQHKHRNGYWFIQIRANGETLYFSIARLVAKYFVDNPHGHAEVNHINEDKDCNIYSNLEWCTRKYNCNYGERNTPISRRVVQLDANGAFVAEYKSAQEAMRQTNIQQSDITRCCQGTRKSAKGTYWKYKDNYNE